MLISIETHMTCDFPGGWSGPLSSLWILACEFLLVIVLQISRLSEGSTGQIFATSSVIYQIKM